MRISSMTTLLLVITLPIAAYSILPNYPQLPDRCPTAEEFKTIGPILKIVRMDTGVYAADIGSSGEGTAIPKINDVSYHWKGGITGIKAANETEASEQTKQILKTIDRITPVPYDSSDDSNSLNRALICEYQSQSPYKTNNTFFSSNYKIYLELDYNIVNNVITDGWVGDTE